MAKIELAISKLCVMHGITRAEWKGLDEEYRRDLLCEFSVDVRALIKSGKVLSVD